MSAAEYSPIELPIHKLCEECFATLPLAAFEGRDQTHAIKYHAACATCRQLMAVSYVRGSEEEHQAGYQQHSLPTPLSAYTAPAPASLPATARHGDGTEDETMVDGNVDGNQGHTKICATCKLEKGISDFFRHDLADHETASCSACRETRRLRDRIARAKDRELREKAKTATMSSPPSMTSEASTATLPVASPPPSSKKRKGACTTKKIKKEKGEGATLDQSPRYRSEPAIACFLCYNCEQYRPIVDFDENAINPEGRYICLGCTILPFVYKKEQIDYGYPQPRIVPPHSVGFAPPDKEETEAAVVGDRAAIPTVSVFIPRPYELVYSLKYPVGHPVRASFLERLRRVGYFIDTETAKMDETSRLAWNNKLFKHLSKWLLEFEEGVEALFDEGLSQSSWGEDADSEAIERINFILSQRNQEVEASS